MAAGAVAGCACPRPLRLLNLASRRTLIHCSLLQLLSRFYSGYPPVTPTPVHGRDSSPFDLPDSRSVECRLQTAL